MQLDCSLSALQADFEDPFLGPPTEASLGDVSGDGSLSEEEDGSHSSDQ
jgi:hypothetical protein